MFEKYLRDIFSIRKLYQKTLEPLGRELGLTMTEMEILAFLSNNPGMDTARDIVQYRMISKANVSQAVEQLIQKELLLRRPDQKDRRRVHLCKTRKAAAPVRRILQAQAAYFTQLTSEVSEQQLAEYARISEKLAQNARTGLTKGEAEA